MQENTLEIKIKKQLEFIKDQIARFKRAFQSKELKSQNFTPYLQALNKVFDLNNSYGEDYFEFIDKKNLDFVLKNNRELMKDVCFKLKGLSLYFQQNKIQTKEKPKKNDGVCNICQQLIDSQNVQQAKNSVEDIGINKLKRMLKMIQQEGNKSMFTPQQDMHFFQQLHRVLTKKQQLLSITDNHLQKYLDDIMKNMQQIKHLQDLKDTSFPLPQSIDWETKIKNQINIVLLGSFKGKVPTWIQKMFDYFLKLHQKFTRQLKQSKQCQTERYVQDEVYQLRNKIQELKEQQKTNKAINQDYLKMIEEKESNIENLSLQIKVIKQNLTNEEMGIISKSLNESLRNLKQSKKQKNYRNSQMKSGTNEQQIDMNGKTKSQHKFKKMSKISSLMTDSLNRSSIARKIKGDLNESQFITENKSNSYRNSLRKEHLITEHLPELQSAEKQENISRKNHKKLTDIQHFRKTKSNSKNQSFLPNIEKLIKDSNGQQKLQQIKKTSILSNYQPVKKPSQKSQILQKLQFSALHEKLDQQKSINQIDQDTVKCNSESEINLSENFTDSERNIRLKKYKQKVSDVQNQLENKVHKIQALKRTFQMKKLNTSASFTAKVSPLYKQFSPLNMMAGQRFNSSIMPGLNFKKPQMKDFMTQTQTQQNAKIQFAQQIKSLNDKRSPRIVRIKTQDHAQQPLLENKQKNTSTIPKPTQESTQLSFFKKFVDNKNILKISNEHIEKILGKILLIDEKNKEQKKQSVKSTHRYPNEKSTKFLQADKSLSQSKVQKSKRDSQKQNVNEKLQQKQGSLSKVLEMKQLSLKQKLIENIISRDISPTTKSKKTTVTKQGHQSLPNISGVHIANKKNQPCCLFTKKDFSLFINEENSFKYESNMNKKYHKTPSIQLTKEQIQNLTSVYGLTQIIKSHSQENYKQIISFLKYPYHSVVNNFGILNFTNEMSLQTWLWHFSLIKYYHQKCLDNNDGNQCICLHIEKFITKIQDTLVEIVKTQICE